MKEATVKKKKSKAEHKAAGGIAMPTGRAN